MMTRRAVIPMPGVILGEFCRNGERHFKVESGLPADARFVSAYYDELQQMFRVIFESPEFDDIDPGQPLPSLAPVVTTNDNGKEPNNV